MTFFFDKNIAWGIVITLRDEHGFIAIERNQGLGPKDEEWLPVAGQNGWVVITLDHGILSSKVEKKALQDNQVTAFFCAKELNGKRNQTKQEWLKQHWTAIQQRAAKAQPGDVFLISWKGKITRWKDPQFI